MSKSYWQPMRVTDADHAALRAWFAPLANDMTPYEAGVLCDIATDREKKLRVYMRDAEGVVYEFTRTRGKTYTIGMKRVSRKADTASGDSVNRVNKAR